MSRKIPGYQRGPRFMRPSCSPMHDWTIPLDQPDEMTIAENDPWKCFSINPSGILTIKNPDQAGSNDFSRDPENKRQTWIFSAICG